jgi:hypothetical protein
MIAPGPARRAQPASAGDRPRDEAGAGRVRPARPADLGALVELHRRAFGRPAGGEKEEVGGLLGELLFGHPWDDPRLPSLVYEQGGAITGALGVLPRPMALEGRTLTLALGHNLMVDPERRGSPAAIELMRTFLCGPQELSIAWGNDAARRLWRGLGIAPAHAWSFRFTLLLRPAAHVLQLARRQGYPALAGLLRPAAALADRLTALHPRTKPARGSSEPLDVETHCALVDRFGRRRRLRPVYRPETLAWMLGLAGKSAADEPLIRRLVRRRGALTGWYVYRRRPRAVLELLQLGGASADLPELLDQLSAEARALGAAAITGALDPAWMPALDERPCLYHRGRSAPWVLAHGRDVRALEALRCGEALLSRLEGEWWT